MQMKPRQILGDVLIVLAVVFTIYLSVVMIRRINSVVLRDDYIKVFRYELLACAIWIVFALDIRFGFFTKLPSAALRVLGWVLRAAVYAAAAVLLFFFARICIGSGLNTAAPAEHAVVLGMALENGVPTEDLLSRLDTAEQYLQENPDAKIVLTGGNPDASGKTEAAVMHDLMIERGIAEDRMILEDQADTTKANFKYTAQLIDPDEPFVLISSNYHMDRAVRTAKNAGFSKVLRLPAPSSFVTFGANVMWEVVLELNELTLRQ